ncbi:MAG: hypothetical protein CO189_10290 [candidate division Zixibacteria bacterium CG_4_9_14_3_um_filter_46_8]|nr:MAG: hypothetical protein CO189_10290 [candidate division Zixibacteria bacterium CG_4_9_14_3_um_filter_46_8]
MKYSDLFAKIGEVTVLMALAIVLFADPAYSSVIEHSINFDPMLLDIRDSGLYTEVTIRDCDKTSEPGKPAIPYLITKILIPANEDVDSIAIACDYKPVERPILVNFAQPPEKTSLLEAPPIQATADEETYSSKDRYPQENYIIIDRGYWGANHIISLQVFPVVYYPGYRRLEVSSNIKIVVYTGTSNNCPDILYNARPIPAELLANVIDNYETSIQYANVIHQPILELPIPYSPPVNNYLEYEYAVITDESLVESYRGLVDWKMRRGLAAGIITVERIDADYAGVDLQEKIRNYIKDAYRFNLTWVLLGGDESIIPIRYAYHLEASENPPLMEQQICDLYYSDLTGDWDVDGDGVYGEPNSDRPDIYPEVYVGRVTATTPEGVEAYVKKLIQYERDPGNGDNSYVTRSLFISADQMVDAGQQVLLGNEMPLQFSVDTTSLAERSDGYSANPVSPTGRQVIEKMNEGFGFISNLNHGSPMHYASKSSYYNQAPKSYVVGDLQYEEHHNAPLTDLEENYKFGVHYSISCDLAAIDMDHTDIWPYVWNTDNCFGEAYIELANKGGIAFLGNSRWGWVPTSYKLEKAFIQTVFGDDPITRHIGAAQALCKQMYPAYRDINYGHILLGDPEVTMWDRIPKPISVAFNPNIDQATSAYKVHAEVSGMPLTSAKVILYKEDDFVAVGYTNSEGNASIEINPQTGGQMHLTVTGDRLMPFVAEVNLIPETNVEENQVEKPIKFECNGNYPNPFNRATAFSMVLDKRSDVVLNVYDIAGRTVSNEEYPNLNAGAQVLIWDAVGPGGYELASGIYLYKLQVGKNTATGKLILVK